MQLVVQLGLVLVLSFVLMRVTGWVVEAMNGLSGKTRLGTFGVAAFLAAVTTSLPELFVGVSAALRGESAVALGNVLGSNIADVSLVMGGAALIGGSVGVVGEFLERDFFTAFLAAALAPLLLMDGNLTRIDGLALLVVYLVYNLTTLIGEKAYRQRRPKRIWWRIWQKLGDRQVERDLVWLVGGVVILVWVADWLVRVAGNLALNMGIPLFLVGLFLVAVGTSLPELAFEIRAIREKEIGMVFGNLLGSVVANSTLVLGLTAIISPIHLPDGFRSYLVATVAFVVMFGVFWVLARTKRRLDRWEGAILVVLYILFACWEFSR